jgi:hypothetical protein
LTILVLTALGLGVLHFGLLVLVSVIAGLMPSATGATWLMQCLSFPASQVSQSRQGEYGLLLWIGNSVLWGAGGCITSLMSWRLWGGKGLLVAITSVLAVALSILLAPMLRAPDWTQTVQQHWEDFEFRLPAVFAVSREENAHREAIHRNLFPDRPLPALAVQRWYFGYRPTSSGFPEYRAVVVAQSQREAQDVDAFVRSLQSQRDAQWSSARWQVVESGEGWRLERSELSSTPGAEVRGRLLRVFSTSPTAANAERGLWLGVVVREGVVPIPVLKQIFAGMLQSVRHPPPAPLLRPDN